MPKNYYIRKKLLINVLCNICQTFGNLRNPTNHKVKIGHQVDFKQPDSVNVIECIELNSNELDNETLINIGGQQVKDNLNNDDYITVPIRKFTAKQLFKIIGIVETLWKLILIRNMDL